MEQRARENWITAITLVIILLRWTWLPIGMAVGGAVLALLADWTPQSGPNHFMAPVIVLVGPGYLLAEALDAFGVFGAGSILPVVMGTAAFYGAVGLLIRYVWNEYRRY